MVIEALRGIQSREELTDEQFANKLGIHRTSWSRIKNCRVPISDKFLVRIDRAFPELGIFLPKDATRSVSGDTKRHQPSQNGKWRALLAKARGIVLAVQGLIAKRATK